MQSIFDVNWVVVIISAFVSFVVGSVWYSETMFGKKWRKGLGSPAVAGRHMGMLLFVEAISCIVMSWVLVLVLGQSLALGILTAVAIAMAVKSNDLFSGKTHYTTAVETGYILIKAVVVIVAYQILT